MRTARFVLLFVVVLNCAHGERARSLPPPGADPFAGLAPLARDEPQPFTFRPGAPPPPTTTRVEPLPFPPASQRAPASRPSVAPTPLKVLRSQPTGENALVGAVTVTFNQPMVPVASLAELATRAAPLVLAPAVKGRFRWLGTQTLAFEPDGRMPFGTEYTASVPAGTRATSGARLERAEQWRFATPRPELRRALPAAYTDQARPDTAVALELNQPVAAAELLRRLTLAGIPGRDLVVVPRAEWAALPDLGAAIARLDPERTIVLRPRRPLAAGAWQHVTIAAGLRGEGGRPSLRALHHPFSTYRPLKVEEIACGDRWRCNPAQGVMVRFNNPLAPAAGAPVVTVTPAPRDLDQEPGASWVMLRGDFDPRTAYTVTVKAGPVDVHGQKLGADVRRTLRTGDITPEVRFPAQNVTALERRGTRQVPLEVRGLGGARLRLVAVDPAQLMTLIERLRSPWGYGQGRGDPLARIKGLRPARHLVTGVGRNGKTTLGLPTDEALGPSGAGTVFAEVRADGLRRDDRWANPYRLALVQVTDVGIMARYDEDQIVAFATSLESAAPLAHAAAELRDRTGEVIWRGATDADGVVRAPGRRVLGKPAPYALWIRHADDRAFALLDGAGDDHGYNGTYAHASAIPPKETLRLHLFTDRSPYRPGDKVHVKGLLRVVGTTARGEVTGLPPGVGRVEYEVLSARDAKIAAGTLALTKSGSFTVDVTLPPAADLGAYRVRVKPAAGPFPDWVAGAFQVEEYRAPEYAVKVEPGAGPHFQGGTLAARVGADYLFGAPMAGAACAWTLSRAGARFSPPGHEGFSFGDPEAWRPDWRVVDGPRRHREGWRRGFSLARDGADGDIVASGEGVLDARGRLAVGAKLAADPQAKTVGPLAFTLEAQVIDRNRQSIASRATIVAHPAARYVGLRPDRTVVRAGERVSVQAVLADLDGRRQPGAALTIEAALVTTKVTPVQEGDGWTYKYEDHERRAASCAVTTAARPEACALALPRPGGYRLRAEATDEAGRRTRTSVWVYAAGPGYVPWRLENASQLELVPDKREYRPGETARILVKSPITPAVGLLTVMRGGIDEARRVRFEGTAPIVEVPIRAYHLPEVHVGLSLARGRVTDGSLGAAAEDLGRPALAHGTVRLPVVLDERRVTVTVAPARPTARPRDRLTVALRTTDAAGRPVRGDVAVMVVDEGVLSLLRYATPDPLAVFYAARGAGAPLVDLRSALLGRREDLKLARLHASRRRGHANQALARGAFALRGHGGHGAGGGGLGGPPKAVASPDAAAAPGGPEEAKAERLDDLTTGADEARTKSAGPTWQARTLFATTAYFNPAVATDADGRAQLTIPLPDNLTTFRIMAVAADEARPDRFGHGEAQVTVRKPLLVRPSLPRFLSVGDRFEAAVMVHNDTGAAGVATVLARGRNVGLAGDLRREVRIPAGEGREVRFPLSALHAGPARLQLAALLGRERDAAEVQVPVLLPVTTEAFATYGMTEGSVRQPVVPPAGALPGYGGLEVSLASTALNGLEDAVRQLVEYPYECTEQTASRVMPIFSLGKILAEFRLAAVADQGARKALAARGVSRLVAQQRYDGGWGYWDGARLSWPYVSAYATYALLRGKESGEAVPAAALTRARAFLKDRLDHPLTQYYEHLDYTSQTASAWVLGELGQHERGHLARLYNKRGELPLFARAWLMTALFRAEGRSGRVRALLRDLDNAAIQTAATARFAEHATESLRVLMHSDDRTDAIVLRALLEVDPGHPLMPKVARGLLDGRIKGAWSTTQANAYALVALARYYRQVERAVPDFAAGLWYGDGALGQAAFKGREMKAVAHEVSLAALARLGARDLTLAKTGPGALYYRIGLRYAPADLRLPPEEQGLSVSRVYEPIRDAAGQREDTVRRGPDGTWEITAGATVRVRVVVVVPDQRYYVAIADPLPAGLEAVNLGFVTSARSRLGGELDDRTYDVWSWYALLAFDHRELRDDRAVLFADRLPAGVYEYTYLARATSLGRFVVAPVKAEEMYHPETFGRSATTVVEVRAKR
ncbi:MAG TPA: MG2 domain-containing protein [Polyangia bacterium]|jgi:hypothetical protein